MKILDEQAQVSCKTTWVPHDVAKGISDPQIFYLLEDRGNSELYLVDRLHAKLYVADKNCLVGSANVSHSAFGERYDGGNIELLVETNIEDCHIILLLDEIASTERKATKLMANSVINIAESLKKDTNLFSSIRSYWVPNSNIPEEAYEVYKSLDTMSIKASHRRVHHDILLANTPPGLDERGFKEHIRHQLLEIPGINLLFEDDSDISFDKKELPALFAMDNKQGMKDEEIWYAFVKWVSYFFADRFMLQEVMETTLRRARVIG